MNYKHTVGYEKVSTRTRLGIMNACNVIRQYHYCSQLGTLAPFTWKHFWYRQLLKELSSELNVKVVAVDVVEEFGLTLVIVDTNVKVNIKHVSMDIVDLSHTRFKEDVTFLHASGNQFYFAVTSTSLVENDVLNAEAYRRNFRMFCVTQSDLHMKNWVLLYRQNNGLLSWIKNMADHFEFAAKGDFSAKLNPQGEITVTVKAIRPALRDKECYVGVMGGVPVSLWCIGEWLTFTFEEPHVDSPNRNDYWALRNQLYLIKAFEDLSNELPPVRDRKPAGFLQSFGLNKRIRKAILSTRFFAINPDATIMLHEKNHAYVLEINSRNIKFTSQTFSHTQIDDVVYALNNYCWEV